MYNYILMLKVRVEWQTKHMVKPSALFITRPSPRAVYFIQMNGSA